MRKIDSRQQVADLLARLRQAIPDLRHLLNQEKVTGSRIE
jgi:hypothetical protein